MHPESPTSSPAEPSSKPFFVLWGGQALSLLGSQATQFALIWWLTLETGSASVLATATFVALFPVFLIGPLAGALVDRWNRRLILLVSDSVTAAVAAILAFFFWQGTVTPTHLFIAIFLRSIAGAFHQPTMMASTTLMVSRKQLLRIQGMNETLRGLLQIGAAPLAGFLLGFMPISAILAIDVATAAFAIVPLFWIRVPQPPQDAKVLQMNQARPSVWSEVVEGFHFVRAWPGLLLLVLINSTTNLFLVPAFSLLPLLVQDHFGKGPLELGWLSACFGIGLVVGGLLLSFWGGFKRRVLTSLGGILSLSLAVSVIGWVPANGFPLALLANFFVGVTIAFANGPIRVAFQIAIPPRFQGRVFTLLQTLAGAAAPLGLLIAGPVAEAFGVQSWFLIGAVATAVMALVGFANRSVRTIEDHKVEIDGTPSK